jgi:hypothetical protein
MDDVTGALLQAQTLLAQERYAEAEAAAEAGLQLARDTRENSLFLVQMLQAIKVKAGRYAQIMAEANDNR